jgi:hypothetical protein
VTSVTGKGNLTDTVSWPDYSGIATGAAASDTICQARAVAGGIANPTKFKAWLSDGSNDAKDRIISNGPWYRLDGVKVADNKAALIAGASTSLFTAIAYTETGVYIKNSLYRVWSGTGNTGIKTTTTCNNWGSALVGDTGRIGDTHTSDEWWTTFLSVDDTCNSTAALYCFEVD